MKYGRKSPATGNCDPKQVHANPIPDDIVEGEDMIGFVSVCWKTNVSGNNG